MLPEFDRRTFLKVAAAVPITPNLFSYLVDASEPTVKTEVVAFHEITFSKMVNTLLPLIKKGAQPISLETFYSALQGDIEIPPGLMTFLVTCDDTLKSQRTQGLRAIEYLETQTGWFIPMVLFAMMRFDNKPVDENLEKTTPAFNDRVHSYMTSEDLIYMIQQGHSVQDHGANHIPLTTLNGNRLLQEVEVNEQKIDNLYGLAGVERTVRAFAYPNGLYKGRVDFIASQGLDLAFSLDATMFHQFSRRFTIGRFRKG